MSTRQKDRLARYYALLSQIEDALSSGTFYQWSIKKRKKLLERLKRYYRQCQHLLSGEKGKEASKWAFMVLLGAGLTGLSPQEMVAQQFEPFNYGLTNVGNDSSPELVDIDGDGDLDAYVGKFDGNINFFRNTSTDSSLPAFSLESSMNAFGLTDVGTRSSPELVDIDGDGDLDAFVGETFGNVFFFRNTSTDSSLPAFSLESSSNAFGLTDVGYNSSPEFVDIDGDGDLDAFVGESGGNVFFFRNTSTDSSLPAFSLESSSNAFGLTDVGFLSIPELVDIDGDGDLDAFVGEGAGNVFFFRNTSTDSSLPAFSLESSSNAFGLTNVGYFSSPELVDIDGDGDLDAFVGENYGNIFFFRNTSTDSSLPAFSLESSANAFGLTDVGSRSSPELVDIDGDGDLDAFVGENFGNVFFFRNTSTDSSLPAFSLESSANAFGLTNVGNFSSPALVDLDGDGDLDALVGEFNGNIFYFENTGNSTSAAFAAAQTNPFGLSDVGYLSSPALVDLDGDGDLDALVGESNGNIFYFENTGNSTSAAFAAAQTNPFGLSDVGYDSSPALVDLDGDGDLDALVGESFGSFIYFENTGNSTFAAFAAAQTNPFGLSDVGNNSSPALVDLDGDGDLDALVGELYGNIIFLRNIAPLLPSRPIPTLGQWGVIILGFLTTILGVVGLRRREGKEVEV